VAALFIDLVGHAAFSFSGLPFIPHCQSGASLRTDLCTNIPQTSSWSPTGDFVAQVPLCSPSSAEAQALLHDQNPELTLAISLGNGPAISREQLGRIQGPLDHPNGSWPLARVLGILGPAMIGAAGDMSTTRILILLGGITVVLPLFLFMVAVAHNPNVNGSVISTVLGGIVFTIFLIGAIFEIKRLIDKP